MPLRPVFVAVVLVLGGSLVSRGDEPPTDLAACRVIADDARRLACYDAQADREADVPAAATPEALFGMDPTAVTTLLQRQRGDTPLQSIESSVATTHTNRAGKLVMGLANGQRWMQVDSGRFHLRPGEPVRIQRAALGSHLLQASGSGRSMRVRRIDVDGTAD